MFIVIVIILMVFTSSSLLSSSSSQYNLRNFIPIISFIVELKQNIFYLYMRNYYMLHVYENDGDNVMMIMLKVRSLLNVVTLQKYLFFG